MLFFRSKTHGFTLLEVLIAMVILALAFSTSFLSLSSAAHHLISLEDKTASTWVALNVIARARVEVIDIPQIGGSTTGTEQMLNKSWHWKLSVYPSGYASSSRITVDVSKSEQGPAITQITSFLIKKSR